MTITKSDTTFPTFSITDGSNDPRVVYWRVYRQDSTQAFPLYIADVTPGSSGVIFIDNNKVQSPRTVDQLSVDMEGGDLTCISGNRLYVVSGNTLRYSEPGQYEARSPFSEEQFTLPDNDTPTALAPLGGGVVIFGRHGATMLTGPVQAGGQFMPLSLTEGCLNQQAWTTAQNALFYVGPTSVWQLNGAAAQDVTPFSHELFKGVTAPSVSMAYDPNTSMFLISQGTRIVTVQTKAGKPQVSVWTERASAIEEYANVVYFADGTELKVYGEDGEVTLDWLSTPLNLGETTVDKLVRRAEMLLFYGGRGYAELRISPLYGEEMAPPAARINLASDTLTWEELVWDQSLWPDISSTQRARVVTPSNTVGTFVQVGIIIKTDRPNQTHLLVPTAIEFRALDRFGRNH